MVNALHHPKFKEKFDYTSLEYHINTRIPTYLMTHYNFKINCARSLAQYYIFTINIGPMYFYSRHYHIDIGKLGLDVHGR
jgi:hypothetical protein